MKAVIIDDEEDGRNVLRKMLNKIGSVELLGDANNSDSGYDLIHNTKPDLVFLDIEMPGKSGFDLLEKFDSIAFNFVFVTAFDHYAIRAIRFNALDYILKPVNPDELKSAIDRAAERKSFSPNYKQLIHDIRHPSRISKIAVPSVSSIKYVELDQILRLFADGNYTTLYMRDGKKLTSTRLLKEYDEMLYQYGFLRVHRSHIVNLHYVTELKRNRNSVAVMLDGCEIEIARQRRQLFVEAMKQI